MIGGRLLVGSSTSPFCLLGSVHLVSSYLGVFLSLIPGSAIVLPKQSAYAIAYLAMR